MLFDITYYTLYLLTIVGIVVVSALVYLQGKEAEYRYFTYFALLLSFWLIVQSLAQLLADVTSIDSTLLLRLSVVVSPFFSVYFFFFAAYHVNLRINRLRHMILPTIFLPVNLLSSLTVQSASASIKGITIQAGPLYYPLLGFVCFYIIWSVLCIVRENRSEKLMPSKRQANNILIIGVLEALIIVSLAAVFLSEEPLAQVLSPLALFLMIATFSYAIVRHRLFDIRLAAVRALAYSFSLVTLGALYSLLAFGLVNALLGYQGNLPQQILYLVIALLLALTFAPLKSFFDNVTRSIFYQDAYEPQKVIDSLSSVLVSTVDIENLGRHAGAVLQDAMKSQYVAVVLPLEASKNKDTKSRIILSGHDGALSDNRLFNLLSRQSKRLLIQDDMTTEKGSIYKSMQAANCAVAARLEAHDDMIGYMLFGVKNNGRPYTSQDIELIHTTTDEIALGIQNALRFEEIRVFNHTLQQKIESATGELRRKNAELRKLDEAKDEFVSMASHQLRTPLTSVKGYISMVLEGDVGKITKMQRQLLGEAFTSSERMVHLINDFLNVSRLQTGKFIIESKPVDLAKVVDQEVNSLKTTAEAHDLKLEYHAPAYFPILYLDDGKIRQVLMNFMDNAIYYSREHTTITVKLFVEDGFAVAEVHDTGIGVPKDEQAHLFTKFFRATNARRQRPDGTGVGLFLAKKVIDAHGGSVVFESTEGEGSVFGFRLPIKKLSTAPKDSDQLKK